MQGPSSAVPSRERRRARRDGSGGCGIRLAAAACVFTCSGAWAQDDPNPYYLGVNQSISHSTNINNVPDGPGDTYSSTGIVGGFNQQIGRQHVYGSANVSLNRYRDFTQLDNTSYGANAAWDWQTIGDLSGNVNGGVSQGLAILQNNLLQQTTDRDLVRTSQFGSRINWGGSGKFTIGGGYGYSQTRYSAATLLAGASNNQTADFGLYFHPGQTLTLGTALRFTRSESDNAYLLADGTYLPNRTNGRNIDFSVLWRPTAQTGANARISYTDQTDSTGGGGFSGLTGELGFTYTPTGKLSFTGTFNRDASTNGYFYNTFNGSTTTQSTVGLAASNSISNSLTAGVTYSATAKVSVVAGASYRRTTQDNGVVGVIGGNYRDNYLNYSLGANWAIRRFWSLGCSASRVDRRISGAFTGNYTGNTYTCSTQVTLQ